MAVYDRAAPKEAVNLTLNTDLVLRARTAGLDLSTLAEEAVAAALTAVAWYRLQAEIAQACQAHQLYLTEYGSLGDALRSSGGAAD